MQEMQELADARRKEEEVCADTTINMSRAHLKYHVINHACAILNSRQNFVKIFTVSAIVLSFVYLFANALLRIFAYNTVPGGQEAKNRGSEAEEGEGPTEEAGADGWWHSKGGHGRWKTKLCSARKGVILALLLIKTKKTLLL